MEYLKFKIFKPKERLKKGDKYQTKPELEAELVKEIKEMGFNIKRVLADSLYGESDSNFNFHWGFQGLLVK